MEIWPTTSATASWPLEADVDLADATAQVFLDGAWHDMTWSGAATHDVDAGTWTRTARLLVRGAEADDGQLVTDADDKPQVRAVVDGETLVTRSTLSFAVHA